MISQPIKSLKMDFYSRIMRAKRFPLKTVHVQICLVTTNYSKYTTLAKAIKMPKKENSHLIIDQSADFTFHSTSVDPGMTNVIVGVYGTC